MSNDFADFHASIVRLCSDLAGQMTVVNFDAHADIGELPAGDLIGPSEFMLEEDNGNHTVTVAIGISTFEDLNLFRMYQVLGTVWTRLKVGSFVTIYNADTGTPRGLMRVMNGTTLMPIGHEKGRPFQFIQVSLGTAEVPTP